MTQRRYEVTEFEWAVIAPPLANKPRCVPRADDRKVLNGIFWQLRTGSPLDRHPGALRPVHHLLQPARPLAKDRRVGSHL